MAPYYLVCSSKHFTCNEISAEDNDNNNTNLTVSCIMTMIISSLLAINRVLHIKRMHIYHRMFAEFLIICIPIHAILFYIFYFINLIVIEYLRSIP